MKFPSFTPKVADVKSTFSTLAMAVVLVAFLAVPDLALAEDFKTKTCGFLTNITDVLNIASIAVVTIAIIFAGYQIAFAHKRIGDVAPIVVGALLIGGATQLAKYILGDDQATECKAQVVTEVLKYIA